LFGYLVLLGAAPELELGEDLVGEGVGHDEGGMTQGAAQVHQPPKFSNERAMYRNCIR